MAIYRPRRSSWPLVTGVAVVALLIGFGVGYLAFGTRPPDLDAAAGVIEDGLTDVRGLVEVAAIEYREAVPDGTVASQAEYDGAREALDRAATAYDAVDSPLASLAPDRAAAIEAGSGGAAHDVR